MNKHSLIAFQNMLLRSISLINIRRKQLLFRQPFRIGCCVWHSYSRPLKSFSTRCQQPINHISKDESIEDVEQVVCFQVAPQDVGQRLDKLLASCFPEQSRTYFEKLIEKRLVRLNGANAVTKSFRVREGDEVEVPFLATSEFRFEAQDIPLDILFEDEDIIVINKPPDMVVHPAPGNWKNTLVNALAYHLGMPCLEENNDMIRPWIVHRLDKGTSGVIVATKTDRAQRQMVNAFKSRMVKKTYIAICYGNPMVRLHVLSGNNIIDMPIGRSYTNRLKMDVIPIEKGGKQAVTVVQGAACNQEGLCIVSLRLMTGRTHQIRVHLRQCSSYILGDELYGLSRINERYKHLRADHCYMLGSWHFLIPSLRNGRNFKHHFLVILKILSNMFGELVNK
eukprot:jgi/Galph1/4235/GphlegSOOS_G2911.1